MHQDAQVVAALLQQNSEEIQLENLRGFGGGLSTYRPPNADLLTKALWNMGRFHCGYDITDLPVDGLRCFDLWLAKHGLTPMQPKLSTRDNDVLAVLEEYTAGLMRKLGENPEKGILLWAQGIGLLELGCTPPALLYGHTDVSLN